MRTFSDISGMKFNMLTVDSFYESRNGARYWNCICECGKKTVVHTANLTHGSVKSCGCLANLAISKLNSLNKKHGLWKTKEFGIWSNIKERCLNEKNKSFSEYGGRGITVCKKWADSFLNFINDVGFRPSQELTLDRINNDGNYEPGNVRWADRKTQANNRRARRWKVKPV